MLDTKLMRQAGKQAGVFLAGDLCVQAADDIDRLRETLERYRAALEWIIENVDVKQAPILIGRCKMALGRNI